LENEKIIQMKDSENNTYVFLDRGKIASNLAEIHPVIGAILTEKMNYFNEFDSTQLIGLFSCFTDIKLPEEYRKLVPDSNDPFLKSKIEELANIVLDLEKNEKTLEMDTGIDYYNMLCYDIVDEIQEWTSMETEQQCKHFIQTRINGKEISVGEFTKAVLKIATITKEFMNIAEELGEIGFLSKLKEIEPNILKYITNAQSLYV
jgi:hypothetical protein